jgi:hypothetical protein
VCGGTVMMQFASEGQWGRGIYFAEDAGMLCSHATILTQQF